MQAGSGGWHENVTRYDVTATAGVGVTVGTGVGLGVGEKIGVRVGAAVGVRVGGGDHRVGVKVGVGG